MMRKHLLFSFVFITLTQFSFAQTSELIVKSGDKGLYLDHKVTAKENFYSVGRLYNAPPKEIAAFNGLDMEKGLSLGQTIRIPLAANFSQTVNKGTPVYYRVGQNESLMKVSNANNKVSLENLRRWNNLAMTM
jgi:LysM repeat protein